MNRKIIGISVCMLLVGTVLPASGTLIIDKTTSFNISGNTLYVGGSGEGNYTRIQDAIDNASDGYTVFVYDDSSPYYEHVIVNKSIFLIGEDKHHTIIDGYENGNPIYVSSDGVTISGFTIMNGTPDYLRVGGVDIFANYTTISNNIIKNNYIGIAIWNDYAPNIKPYLIGNVISNNTISSNTLEGIWLSHCNLSTVTNNIIINNNIGGIHTNFVSNNIILGNKISNNYNGLVLFQGSNSNIILSNNITNNGLYGIYILDSGKNEILYNNFIENGERNVKLLYYIWNLKRNKWEINYWDKPRSFPYLIFGKISILLPFGIIPWFEIDWNPAREPYDI